MERSRIMGATLVAAGTLGTLLSSAWGDQVSLRGGATIKGVVVPDPQQPTKVLIQTETAAKPLAFDKSQVLGIAREPGALDDYLAQKDKVEATAQAQYDFGLWCEESHITGPAANFYRKAVELDPQFGPAHKKLGHVQQGDRWVTYDQQREAQGLVKYKGKWISKVEKGKIDAKVAQTAAQASWTSRLKMIRRKLHDGDSAARMQAEKQLHDIRDPAAVPGLIQVFVGDGDTMRVRLAQLIGAIPGPEAAEGLVYLLLNENDAQVRAATVEELLRRGDKEVVGKLVAALRSKDGAVISRAALSLAGLKAVSAVPKLVEALIQKEERTVMVPVEGGSGGGSLGGTYSFGQNTSPGAGGHTGGAAGAQGFTTVRSYGVITGAAVAPGAVAFGSSSVGVPSGGSTGYSNQSRVSEVPMPMTFFYQNAEVLQALEDLTHVDFGYDQPSWRRWIATSFRTETRPARRVPQP